MSKIYEMPEGIADVTLEITSVKKMDSGYVVNGELILVIEDYNTDSVHYKCEPIVGLPVGPGAASEADVFLWFEVLFVDKLANGATIKWRGFAEKNKDEEEQLREAARRMIREYKKISAE